jgi:hypothetical protein
VALLGLQLSRPKHRAIVTGTTVTGIVGVMIGGGTGTTMMTTVTRGEAPGSGSSSEVVTATVTGDAHG